MKNKKIFSIRKIEL